MGAVTSGLSRRRFLGLGLAREPRPSARPGAGCSVDDPRIEAPARSAEPGTAPKGSAPASSRPFPDADLRRRHGGSRGRAAAGRAGGGHPRAGPWRESARRPQGPAGRHPGRPSRARGRPPRTPADGTRHRPGRRSRSRRPTQAKSLESALKRLAKAEVAQAARHRTAALGTTGYSALVVGVALGGGQQLRVRTDERPAGPGAQSSRPTGRCRNSPTSRRCSSSSDRLHAIIYGYQLAIGQLADGGAPDRRPWRRLREHRILLDCVDHRPGGPLGAGPGRRARLRPVGESPQRRDGRALIESMEIALAPFCGLWLAAANDPERAARLLRTLHHGRDRSPVGRPDQRLARLGELISSIVLARARSAPRDSVFLPHSQTTEPDQLARDSRDVSAPSVVQTEPALRYPTLAS